MSISAPLSVASGTSTGVPVVDQAREPALVRQGGTAAKNAYQTGLAFEQMLTSELAQTMTDTISGADPSSSGTSGSEDSSSQSALGPYASMLPQALSSSLVSGGGTGVAMQIARSIDPQRDAPPVRSGS